MPDATPAGRALVREFTLDLADNERLANLCGPLDDNLRSVEARLGVEIRRRGSAFRVQGERAAAWAPMVAPAPARFSITTDWPRAGATRLPINRAMASTLPPAGYGTISLIGWLGHVCAIAVADAIAAASEAAASRWRRLICR